MDGLLYQIIHQNFVTKFFSPFHVEISAEYSGYIEAKIPIPRKTDLEFAQGRKMIRGNWLLFFKPKLTVTKNGKNFKSITAFRS